MKNVIYLFDLMLFFPPFISGDPSKADLGNLNLEWKRTESFVGAVGPLLVIWIIYLIYMLITKKDKEKIIEFFSMGFFFLAIWTLLYLVIF